MKKLIYFGMAAIIALATISCKKAGDGQQSQSNEQQTPFKESDLFGLWIHSVTSIGDNGHATANLAFFFQHK